ncbi:Conserved_hypothetical protein [Hexamita inflata]|uniref:Uncharacterized protein n=1 Tax=Hexamita inflata TaxID=28002 RepID=A0ABP1J669_9EUKA
MQVILIYSQISKRYGVVLSQPLKYSSFIQSQVCSKQLLTDKILTYCMKEQSLSSQVLTGNIAYSRSESSFYSMYTQKAQNILLNSTYYIKNLPSFALFHTQTIQIQSSCLNLLIPDSLSQAALICFQCNLNTSQTDFSFQVSAQNASGLVLMSQALVLDYILVQLRAVGSFIGGLVYWSQKTAAVISNSNVSVYVAEKIMPGSISVFVVDWMEIQAENSRICANVGQFGSGAEYSSISGIFNQNCDLCREKTHAYGICVIDLENGKMIQQKLVCKEGFEFDGEKCVCPELYVKNGSTCVNILEQINILITSQITQEELNFKLTNNISTLNNSIQSLKNEVQQNLSSINKTINDFQSNQSKLDNLEANIMSNYSKMEQKLAHNTSILDIRIYQNITQLEQQIRQNSSVLEQRIISNYTASLNNLQTNTIQLEQWLISNISIIKQQQTNLQLNQSYLEQQIIYNATRLDIQILNNVTMLNNTINNLVQVNCTKNNGYAFVNGVCVQQGCSVLGQQRVNGICQCALNAIVKDNACTCPQFSVLVEFSCICPQDSIIISSVCTCNVVSGQTMKNGICACPNDQYVINGKCQSVSILIGQNTPLECNVSVFVNTFNIQAVTNQILSSDEFSSGYVFSSGFNVQNAFIDVADSVYSKVKPLFQGQNTYNNIKIQIGSQSIKGGSLVTSFIGAIIINNMNIISKTGSQLILNSGKFSILMESSANANISNLHVNLNFAMSAGNITLIYNAWVFLSINGYEVLGTYQSTKTIAMISIYVYQAPIVVNQVIFKPSVYNAGNCSSYLFSRNWELNQFSFSNIAIILGNETNNQLFGSISSTSELQYQFGGFIARVCDFTAVTIQHLIMDCYQQYGTNFVKESGLLVGTLQQETQCQISDMCLKQSISGSTIFRYFGLFGDISGDTLLQQVSLTIIVHISSLNKFGLIGQQSGYSLEIINIIASVNTDIDELSNSENVGILLGYIQQESTSSVVNVSIIDSNISSKNTVSGFFGTVQSNQKDHLTSIVNSTVSKSNISGSSNVGGFFSSCESCSIELLNSTIFQVNISGSSCTGGFIGNYDIGNANSVTFSIQNSTISQANISGANCTGGLLGYSSSKNQSTISISSSQIISVRISATENFGIILGFDNKFDYYGNNKNFATKFQFQSSNSSGNSFANGVLVPNCPNFVSGISLNGC